MLQQCLVQTDSLQRKQLTYISLQSGFFWMAKFRQHMVEQKQALAKNSLYYLSKRSVRFIRRLSVCLSVC